ncbi:hypothetical protein H633G_10135 [Metarhizium anisopliae BRIP 53284]|nr:hypothetical protein H633G_10135 [Metarhizium anisopliae BRIP 53284]
MALEVTGHVQTRFIEVATLLHLIDPVRGEPVDHGLGLEGNETELPRDCLLKRKFLDSFALVCAVRKDGDTVSAAAMEERMPEGTVIRVASNHGLSESTLSEIRDMAIILNEIAIETFEKRDRESELLAKIVHLDSARITYYLKVIYGATRITEQTIFGLKSKMADCLCCPSDDKALTAFLEWLKRLSIVQAMPLDSEPNSLIALVRWALQAKQTYISFLRLAFFPGGKRPPAWIYAIFKLGRYAIAAKALIQLALEFPGLFNPMIVEPVSAPPKRRFKCPEVGAPLTSVLRRIVGGHEIDTASRLARVWDVLDAESHFRKTCTLDLWVHAEVQLVSFYDHHPERKPAFRFVGVTTDHRIFRRYKAMTINLSKDMEEIAKQDLNSRLGVRRSIPPDSTAGVSLSGLIGMDSSGRENAGHTQAYRATGVPAIEQPDTIVPHHLTTALNPASQHEEVPQVSGSTKDSPVQSWTSITPIVFHIARIDNANKQDIVAITDIVDPVNGNPSWKRLVEILATGGEFGVDYTEGEDFLMVGVEEPIRVATERQFMAFVTFLRNSMVTNTKVSVHKYAEMPR